MSKRNSTGRASGANRTLRQAKPLREKHHRSPNSGEPLRAEPRTEATGREKATRKTWLTQTELGHALGLSKRKTAEVVAELNLPHLRYSSKCLKFCLEDVETKLKASYGVNYQ